MAVACLLALAGCGDDAAGRGPSGGDPPDAVRAASDQPLVDDAPVPDADLAATITRTGDTLEVRWSLTDRGDGPLLLTDRVPVPAGAGVRYRTDAAHVTADAEGHVVVSQARFDQPVTEVDTSWESVPRIGVTEVGAGTTTRRVVTAPLAFAHPYGDDLGSGPVTLPDLLVDVTYCLGVLDPADPAVEATLETDDGVTTTSHASPGQHLLCSPAVPLS